MAIRIPISGSADNDTFDFHLNEDDAYDIKGLGGDDTLTGGQLGDIISGGGGNDLMKGEGGNDKMLGGGGDDVMFGGDGKDVMNGGSGIDYINGNAGNATLTGGGGADDFQVDKGAGRVVITDFTDDIDTLLIDSDFFPGKSVEQILTKFGSSSGGDSAIDLSRVGDDAPRIILLGVDNIFDLKDDIILV